MPKNFIPKHGGYENLRAYQKATIVYDATIYFCDRFLRTGTRTHDQMIQAARSGKQNIAEGNMASATCKQTEIHLTNVARASQEELLADYQDCLRKHRSEEWPKEHPYRKRLQQLNRIPNATYTTFQQGIENEDPTICANVIIGLVRVTCYLLDRQLEQLQEAFLEEGGIRERMTKARLERRAEQQQEKDKGPKGRKGPKGLKGPQKPNDPR